MRVAILTVDNESRDMRVTDQILLSGGGRERLNHEKRIGLSYRPGLTGYRFSEIFRHGKHAALRYTVVIAELTANALGDAAVYLLNGQSHWVRFQGADYEAPRSPK